MFRIELGGGAKGRGPGWVNVDLCPEAEIQHDLNVLPWPLADASVDAVYSSHCIEHVKCPISFLREIARICKTGAEVEIRCPDPFAEMAMCAGHESVVSIMMLRHASEIFPASYFGGRPRRLRLARVVAGPDSFWFPQARNNPLFRGWTDDDILTWLPRTRHENQFHLTVEPCTL